MTVGARIAELSDRLRRAPLGILLLAALFGILGVGTFAAGVYLLLTAPSPTLWSGALALIAGPAIVYAALSLVTLARWAWLALLLLTVLLVASTLIRIAVAPGIPPTAIAELAAEAVAVRYLTRPRIRNSFAPPADERDVLPGA